ncbi:MAG: hypothetical protein ONB48_06455 [candidate division KSB1 bacterium]|nr:hypothetical protein [candidate division KSB1 bacterium]MDZ7273182.1 hypothetical protein [candidate division KSB1 bacterium]MDZ7285284.1 hypothetical protein [candidate division KSB1 bacterium]MDZ7298316.1 hypothetical protein [candidate division KSB1 bacterium]MDZ7307391.1 hypothetical protein [candidate division KSB1 bacterium]
MRKMICRYRDFACFTLAGIFCLLSFSNLTVLAAESEGQQGGRRTASTMSEVNAILRSVDFEVLLRTDTEISKGIGAMEGSYLLPLTNYLDLNFIGAGKSVTLDPEIMIDFIVERLGRGQSIETIGLELVTEFKKSGFVRQTAAPAPKVSDKAESAQMHVGGFVVGELEYHQEPDGSYHHLLELNQVRIYFATQLNSRDEGTNLGILAEFNPVPEEVIHQIEEIAISRNGISDTLRLAAPESDEVIPFEQLYLKIHNIGKSGVALTVGQIRLPFGIWSDYTSHRNFSSTKNNVLVNGFALKKIDLGILVEKVFPGGLDLKAALVHGRQGRTSSLSREDFDNGKDFVGRFGFSGRRFSAGFSSYLAEFAVNRKVAFGLDWQVSTNRLLLSGEAVLQKNNRVNTTFATNFDFNTVSSRAAYVQFDYLLTPKLHLYGLYETWRFLADGATIENPAYKVFHGLRYYIHPQFRWTVVEFGRMFHEGFDKGKLHLSSQLEMTF